MALLLLIGGVVLVDVAIRNTWSQLGSLIAADFTGSGSFLYWVVAVAAIGAVGYAKPFSGFANLFLALLVLVFFLKNGTGFFSQLQQALSSTPAATPAAPLQPIAGGIPVTLTLGGSSGSSASGLGSPIGNPLSIIPGLGGL